MKIDVDIDEERATVSVTGSMTAGEELDAFRNTIEDLLRRGYEHIILDISGVVSIDSAGLGEIVCACTAASRQGGKLRLLGLPKRVQDVLSIAKMLTTFESTDSTSPDARRNAAVWFAFGVLLVLALLVIARFAGVRLP